MSIRQSRSSALDADKSEGKEQVCEMKWCHNVVICWENLRSL